MTRRSASSIAPRAFAVAACIALVVRGTSAAYELDDPAGPEFTEAEKASQRAAGETILPLVARACEAGAATVRIPPGHYRFGDRRDPGGRIEYVLEFAGLRRTAANPLTIDASGATFWFDLADGQSSCRCLRFRECSHVIFHGATLDRGTRGHIEGTITQFDVAANRIEIQISPGINLPESFNGNSDQRVVPFKADGRFCAPLYALQAGQRLRYDRPVPGTAPGRVWIPLVDPALLAIIRDPAWREAHGDLGTLAVGDGLSCIHSRTHSITLCDSDSLTMSELSVHVAKGCPSEEGGAGGHVWRDCFFGPRPGTNQWQGGDGFMFNGTRRGTTLLRVTVEHSTDDVANVHGYWSRVGEVAGDRLTFVVDKPFYNTPSRPLLASSAKSGDRLRFYDPTSGVVVGDATVTALDDDTATLDRSAAPFAGMLAEWEDHVCAGFRIEECTFRDSYQRLVIKSGPGVVRGCTFTRMGKGIEFSAVLPYVEGCVPRGIVIEGNSFVDVNSRLPGAAIAVYAHAFDRGAAPWLEGIVIRDNVFRLRGDLAIALSHVRGLDIRGNRVERRGRLPEPPGTATVGPSADERAVAALSLRETRQRDAAHAIRHADGAILLESCPDAVVTANVVTARETP